MCCEIFNDRVYCLFCSMKRRWMAPTFMFSEAPFAISYDAQPSLAKPTIAPTRSRLNHNPLHSLQMKEAFVSSCIFETKYKSDISHLALHRGCTSDDRPSKSSVSKPSVPEKPETELCQSSGRVAACPIALMFRIRTQPQAASPAALTTVRRFARIARQVIFISSLCG
jgi:hypothetical protein